MLTPEEIATHRAEELAHGAVLTARELLFEGEKQFDVYLLENRHELLAAFRQRFEPAFRIAEGKQTRPAWAMQYATLQER